jgi:hypothetical protein
MGLKKIFSGSEILAQALQSRLEATGIGVIVKNNIQSARMAGFGQSAMAVEVFIEEYNMEKADPIIESFKMGE